MCCTRTMRQVAALCVDRVSAFKKIAGVDCYDRERDARSFPGGMPVVAMPPCAQWSRLRSFAAVVPEEKELADFCLEVVRREGGVLEHPYPSRFFRMRSLDAYVVDQSWFGFRARKRTGLYVVGVELRRLPPLPLQFGAACGVEDLWSGVRARCTGSFAGWLVEIARLTKGGSDVQK